MTALDPNPAFESGLQCGLLLGCLLTGFVGTLLWGILDALQGRLNRPPVNPDWPEEGR